MILAGCSLAETNTTDSIGGVDCSVDRQARRGDGSFLLEFVLSRGQVLLGLGQIAACLVRTCLGIAIVSEFGEASSVDDESFAADVTPHRLPAPQSSTDLVRSHLENLDRVPADPVDLRSPLLDRVRPCLVGLLDTHGADEHHVDIALCVRFSSRKGAEDNHRLGLHGQLSGDASHLLNYSIAPSCERYQWTGGDVFGNEPKQQRGRYLSAFNEPQLNQPREHARGLCKAHTRQARDGPQVQLSSGLSQHSEYTALHTRDDSLDRSYEVHAHRVHQYPS